MTLRRILPLITASILIFFASPQPAHAAEIQPGGDPGALLNSAGLATPQLAFGCDMAIGIETTQCGALMDLYTAGMRGVGDTGAAWGTTPPRAAGAVWPARAVTQAS